MPLRGNFQAPGLNVEHGTAKGIFVSDEKSPSFDGRHWQPSAAHGKMKKSCRLGSRFTSPRGGDAYGELA